MKMGRVSPKNQMKGRKFPKPEAGESMKHEKGESPKFEKGEDAMGMMKGMAKGKK